ncbi:MAG TPA: DUF952 domain-containing protein [Stenomitos sp.]
MNGFDELVLPAGLALSTDGIYHIASASAWEQAQQQGWYVSSSLASEGFIHCSYGHQVVETVRVHFQGQTNLVLLEIDPSLLEAPLKLECSRNGEVFPHLYGELNCSAVTSVLPLEE